MNQEELEAGIFELGEIVQNMLIALAVLAKRAPIRI